MSTEAATYRILIADDDKSMRSSLDELLTAVGWQTEAVARAEAVPPLIPEFQPDVILSDVRMPGMSGLELLSSLDQHTAPPIVLISAHGDIPMAVQAIQDGAYSFVEKPYDPRRLLTILRHAAEAYQTSNDRKRLSLRLANLSGLDRILLGEAPDVRAIRDDVIQLSDTDASVLIVGETGTGKELVARALHDLSARSARPFVALNCAAIPVDRFEEEMFGIKGGGKGHLLSADGGTLFLDEVSALPDQVQAKLLRVIETREFIPLGSDTPVQINLRIVSASNDDPEKAAADGRFRTDLLYRLNTIVLTLPPLRNRREDLSLLFAHFVQQSSLTYEIDPPEMTQDDVAALLAHDWPGNVRELRSVAERVVLATRRGQGSVASAIGADQGITDMPGTLREAVAAFERELISKAVVAHRGRMDAVAEALGIGRRTLNEKIVKLGLDKDSLL